MSAASTELRLLLFHRRCAYAGYLRRWENGSDLTGPLYMLRYWATEVKRYIRLLEDEIGEPHRTQAARDPWRNVRAEVTGRMKENQA